MSPLQSIYIDAQSQVNTARLRYEVFGTYEEVLTQSPKITTTAETTTMTG
jgi:hypothetical protein